MRTSGSRLQTPGSRLRLCCSPRCSSCPAPPLPPSPGSPSCGQRVAQASAREPGSVPQGRRGQARRAPARRAAPRAHRGGHPGAQGAQEGGLLAAGGRGARRYAGRRLPAGGAHRVGGGRARGAGALGDGRAAPAVLQALRTESQPEVVRAAASALGQIDPEAADVLVPLAVNPGPMQLPVVSALAECRTLKAAGPWRSCWPGRAGTKRSGGLRRRRWASWPRRGCGSGRPTPRAPSARRSPRSPRRGCCRAS
jgi:hypothetical protein